MTATSLNFALLDANRSEVARLIAAMVQARDAVERRSWSHPQESSSSCSSLAPRRASGSLATLASRTILPASSTMQTLVSLTETSSPAK